MPLRVRTVSKKKKKKKKKERDMRDRPCLNSFNFGLKCHTTVIFGIMKDGSFMLNTLNIIIRFTCRTSFKMTLMIHQKRLKQYLGFDYQINPNLM